MRCPRTQVKWLFIGSPTCEKHAIYSEQLCLVLLLVSLLSPLIPEPTDIGECLFSSDMMIINKQQSVQTQTTDKITTLSKKHKEPRQRDAVKNSVVKLLMKNKTLNS